MTTYIYLQSKEHYNERYDSQTIEKCRRVLDHHSEKAYLIDEAKKINASEKQIMAYAKTVGEIYVYFYTGDRYINKEETIRKWMKEDEERDALLERAPAPEHITCLTCGRLMFVGEKFLRIGFDKDPDRVLFYYECPLKHIPLRAFFNDGKEFKREKPVCPKCKTPVREDDEITDAAFITILTCPQCGNVERSEIERTANKPKLLDPDFEKDRARFCLSEKDGFAFTQAKQRMDEFAKLSDRIKEKETNKALYEKVAQLKRLKIIELEEFLSPVLEKEGYIKLQFKNPEITKDVVVPFIVYDQKPDRNDRASTYDLEKFLRKTLLETNWRLMSDGTNYRLGMLEGRLHGYEKEDDLVNLVRQQEKKNNKS
jgi:uncharacterized protein with PIN domain